LVIRRGKEVSRGTSGRDDETKGMEKGRGEGRYKIQERLDGM
jgi:hypothetical protein